MGTAEKAFTIILSIILGALFAFWLQPQYVLVVQTDYSVNFLLGMMDKKDHSPEVGEYMAFDFLAVKDDPRYGWKFVKVFACKEGDYLENRGRSFYCNGRFLGTAKTHSKEGEPLPLFTYNDLIPKNSCFAVGETRDSYDSKYWGFVKREWIIGTVQKLI